MMPLMNLSEFEFMQTGDSLLAAMGKSKRACMEPVMNKNDGSYWRHQK